MKDAPLYDLMIQASINSDNQLMVFYDFSWKYVPYTFRSTGAYIIFYQGGQIYHGTHVPGPVYQSKCKNIVQFSMRYRNGLITFQDVNLLIVEQGSRYSFIGITYNYIRCQVFCVYG